MSLNEFTQRTSTQNQSTADISHRHIFLFDNKYSEGIFNNNTGAAYDLKPGTVVIRNASAPTKVIPAVAGATLVNIVGVVAGMADVEGIADGADVDITYGHGGSINKNELILPDGVTLDTVPTGAGKTVGDILEALGFDLEAVTENTKTDN